VFLIRTGAQAPQVDVSAGRTRVGPHSSGERLINCQSPVSRRLEFNNALDTLVTDDNADDNDGNHGLPPAPAEHRPRCEVSTDQAVCTA
jgi:hypothetical protein